LTESINNSRLVFNRFFSDPEGKIQRKKL